MNMRSRFNWTGLNVMLLLKSPSFTWPPEPAIVFVQFGPPDCGLRPVYPHCCRAFTFGVECELGHDATALANNNYTVPTYPFSISSTFMPIFAPQ